MDRVLIVVFRQVVIQHAEFLMGQFSGLLFVHCVFDDKGFRTRASMVTANLGM